MGLNVRTGHCKFSIQLCSGVEWGMLHLLSCIVFCTFNSVKTNTIHTGIPHFPKRFPVPTSFFDFLIIISKRVFIVFDYTIAGVFLKESKTHWNSKIRAYWCTGLWLRLISAEDEGALWRLCILCHRSSMLEQSCYPFGWLGGLIKDLTFQILLIDNPDFQTNTFQSCLLSCNMLTHCALSTIDKIWNARFDCQYGLKKFTKVNDFCFEAVDHNY